MSRVSQSLSKAAINQHNATTTKPLEANGPENSHSVNRSTIQRFKKSKTRNANKKSSCAAAEWKLWWQATNPKPQAIKATVTPSLQLCIVLKKLPKIYIFGWMPAVIIIFQMVICRGYSRTACLNANIFISNRPISVNLDFLPEPLPKHSNCIRKFSKSTG